MRLKERGLDGVLRCSEREENASVSKERYLYDRSVNIIFRIESIPIDHFFVVQIDPFFFF